MKTKWIKKIRQKENKTGKARMDPGIRLEHKFMTSDPIHLLEVGLWGSPQLSLTNTGRETAPLCRHIIHEIKAKPLLRKGIAIPVTGGREKYSPWSSQGGHAYCNSVPGGVRVHMAGV